MSGLDKQQNIPIWLGSDPMRSLLISTFSFLKKKLFSFTCLRGRETETDGDLIQWFTQPMSTSARAALQESQEPGTQSGFPTWVAEIQVFEPSPAFFQEAGRRVELALKPRHSEMGCRGKPSGILTAVLLLSLS